MNYNQHTIEPSKNLNSLGGLFDLEKLEADIAELDDCMLQPGFWDNPDQSREVIHRSNTLKKTYNGFNELAALLEEQGVILHMLEEYSDDDLLVELEENTHTIREKMDTFELALLLSHEYDHHHAIVELHPGAGGTESQDWGEMLLRMYMRYAESKGFSVEILDYQNGEEAGIKSVTLYIKGDYAYGLLKAEKGVHRLVRISPFDSSGRRHTSFVSVNVTPDIDDTIEIDISPDDLRIDTYRASGAGGQHINKTESAVRITHQPTGIVAQSQSGRSQLQNREQAMQLLKAKLYQKEQEEKEVELAKLRGEQKEIGWGSQIRSYVFHPYAMVKDHRTNVETGNTDTVMDGALDMFIHAYLRDQITHD